MPQTMKSNINFAHLEIDFEPVAILLQLLLEYMKPSCENAKKYSYTVSATFFKFQAFH